ncbi:MAG TPA: hypothetical protein ENF95_01180 [Candidatus Aenigmarchaeota archaeon]|nr:hypothetical protein [Candidatus Aenigmarchaeota archaeon]
MRKNVLFRRYELEPKNKMRLLAGKMTHRSLQKKAVMERVCRDINKELGYETRRAYGHVFVRVESGNFVPFTVEKEKFMMIQVLPGKYIRMHSDISTTLYTIEIKTTTLPLKFWKETVAPYHIMQLNTYMGFSHHRFGFLWKVDLNFYKSESRRWSYIWNNYFRLYPVMFNQALFNYTLERARDYFKYTELENPGEIPCPEFPEFECNNECREYCPNPIDKVKVDVTEVCEHCKKEIYPGTQMLIRNDQTYHYTDEKGHPYEACVKACKDAWRCDKK